MLLEDVDDHVISTTKEPQEWVCKPDPVPPFLSKRRR
jgi:hypothetical protein